MLKLKTCCHTEIVIVFLLFIKTGFTQMICIASLSVNVKDDEAWSIIFKAVFSSKISQNKILIRVL